MPANFLTMVYYILGLALVIALLASIVAVGFTIFSRFYLCFYSVADYRRDPLFMDSLAAAQNRTYHLL